MKSFLIRLRSAICITALTFVFCYFGGYWLLGALILVSWQAQFELYRAYKIQKSTFAVISYIMTAAIYALLLFNLENYMVFLLIANVLLYIAIFVFKFPKYKFTEVAVAFMGVFYISIMLSYIYATRILDNGIYWIWFVLLFAWGSDTFAYLIGMLLGKHKFLPKLSPKKTIEGCVGGVAGAALFGIVYILIFGRYFLDDYVFSINVYVAFALIGALGSVVAQIGDLAASAIKRQCEIKDYGTTIPGHGGFLDRFDSVIFVAPLCYFMINILADPTTENLLVPFLNR